MERMHAAKECKASSVLSKFKEMEKRVANGEDLDDDAREYTQALKVDIEGYNLFIETKHWYWLNVTYPL